MEKDFNDFVSDHTTLVKALNYMFDRLVVKYNDELAIIQSIAVDGIDLTDLDGYEIATAIHIDKIEFIPYADQAKYF